MVRVLVCKNDGVFEFEATELMRLGSWSDVKMDLARALYAEEDLFAVASARDICLYAMPTGGNIEKVSTTTTTSKAAATPMVSLAHESKWVLDIFGSAFRQAIDLSIHTDLAIRSNDHIESILARRVNDSTANPLSPLGNAYSPRQAAPLPQHHHQATPVAPSAMIHEPYIHIGTWVPMLDTDKTRASSSSLSSSSSSSVLNGIKPMATEYEDVLRTTNRAREYINKFRRLGRPVTILSIQSVTLPLAVACPNAISMHGPRSLYDGVFHLHELELQRGFVQAVRFWFSFDCEQTISVTKTTHGGTLGLKPLRQQDGWIVVQALPGSPAFDAGMRGEEVFLTHVNGVDVSPHAFPSVCDKYASQISWKDSVIPLVEKTETCIFTFF